jgi:hypothetical protein
MTYVRQSRPELVHRAAAREIDDIVRRQNAYSANAARRFRAGRKWLASQNVRACERTICRQYDASG